MSISGDIRNCLYCGGLIRPDDDSQRIEKGKAAHTSCAWHVNDAFFVVLDAEHAVKVNDDDAD